MSGFFSPQTAPTLKKFPPQKCLRNHPGIAVICKSPRWVAEHMFQLFAVLSQYVIIHFNINGVKFKNKLYSCFFSRFLLAVCLLCSRKSLPVGTLAPGRHFSPRYFTLLTLFMTLLSQDGEYLVKFIHYIGNCE